MRTVKITLVATALALAGCSTSMNIQSDHDREVSFDGLHSYVWVEGSKADQETGDLAFDNEIMARRVQKMVHAELANLGYTRVDSFSAQPDFAISHRMLATEEIEGGHSGGSYGGHGFRHGGRGFGHGGHGFGYGGYGSGTYAYTRDVVRCVLMLNVLDPETNQLIWRGWVRWMMDEEPSPEQVTQHLRQAVEKILSEFPPGRASKVPRVSS